MPQVNKQALLPYLPHQMYLLVNDVKNYPSFVPKCSGATILSESEALIIARLELSLGPLASAFTTRNKLKQDQSVTMSLEDGPFRNLEGIWLFKPLGDEGCKVSLDLEFEFSNPVLSLAFNGIFKKLTEELFDSFISRANRVYQYD